MKEFYLYVNDNKGFLELNFSSNDLQRLIKFNNELHSKGYVIDQRLFKIVKTFQEVLEILNNIDFQFDSIEIIYLSGYYLIFFNTMISKAINQMSNENIQKFWIGIHLYIINENDLDEIMDLANKYKIDLILVKGDYFKEIEVNEK
jgi:hypothetical protein